jgi:hypothetical protein
MAEPDGILFEDSEECGNVIDELEYKCECIDTNYFHNEIFSCNTALEFKSVATKWIEKMELEVAEMRRLIELIPD